MSERDNTNPSNLLSRRLDLGCPQVRTIDEQRMAPTTPGLARCVTAARLLAIALMAGVATACFALPAGAQDNLRSIKRTGQRPPNFYGKVHAKDKPLCDRVLSSLNKGYNAKSISSTDNLDLYGELLLAASSEVAWDRRVIKDEYGNRTGFLDSASVDLANTGSPLSLHRWTGVWGDSNALMTADPSLVRELSSGGAFPDKLVHELLGGRGASPISLKNHVKIEIPLVSPDEFSYPQFLNVVEVLGRYEILAARSSMGYDALSQRSPVDVYVIEYRAPSDMSVICDFRSKSRYLSK